MKSYSLRGKHPSKKQGGSLGLCTQEKELFSPQIKEMDSECGGMKGNWWGQENQ